MKALFVKRLSAKSPPLKTLSVQTLSEKIAAAKKAAENGLRALRTFNISELDFDNIGAWPPAIKVLVWTLAFALALLLGYLYNIQSLRLSLQQAAAREQALKTEFGQKALQAANMGAYKEQMQAMEQSFGALVSQLPSDTEVPGLLEDISNKGLRNGLEFDSIELQAELPQAFYIELPIKIIAGGSYHDLGAFISDMAGLSRIVTLHDFHITRPPPGLLLRLEITAKIYRYREDEA